MVSSGAMPARRSGIYWSATTMTTRASNLEADSPPADPSASAFKRLSILLRLAEGAWALAVYEDAAVQRAITVRLRDALAPLPVLEISLLGTTPDPLALLRRLE